MSRIEPLDPKHDDGSNREVFQQILNDRGEISTLVRTVGHRPGILRALVGQLRETMRAGSVPERLKYLVAAHICQIHGCDSLLADHVALARRLGAKAEQIEGMRALTETAGEAPEAFPADCLGTAPIEPPPGPHDSDEVLFTPGERAALIFADRMARGSGHVPEEIFRGLAERFGPAEIVEIASTAALSDSLCRFANALTIDGAR